MELRARQQFQTLIAVCTLGIMSLYHFVLFMFRRENKENLWFALFCLMVFIRSFFVGNDLLIYNLVESFDWTWSRRIEFATFYLTAGLGVKFCAELYPKESNKLFVQIFQIIVLAVCLFVIIAPHILFSKNKFSLAHADRVCRRRNLRRCDYRLGCKAPPTPESSDDLWLRGNGNLHVS